MSSIHSSTYSARITPDLLKLIDEAVGIANMNPPCYQWINDELDKAQQRAMVEFSRLQGWTLSEPFSLEQLRTGRAAGYLWDRLGPYKNANLGWIDHYRQNYRPYRPVAMVVHLYVYPYKTISQRGLPKELVAAWLDCQSWYAHDIRPILVMRRDVLSASAKAA